MHILHGSVRHVALQQTINAAKKIAHTLGITRVTDITRLDAIGMPVFASIRPEGRVLCVHNGKGASSKEAEVGAYMEAIEFACADPLNSDIYAYKKKYRDICSHLPQDVELTDFCFRVGRSCQLDDEVYCVRALDLISKTEIDLPEELFFLPSMTSSQNMIYGFTTNGLASGNTVLEASVHAICEIIERDTLTFEKIIDNSKFVDCTKIPKDLAYLCESVQNAGLEISLRYLENEFGVPVFKAYIFEERSDSYCSAVHGCGAHPFKSIAASRAITEAIQSRLTAIHGGRDDLIGQYHNYEKIEARSDLYNRLKKQHFSRQNWTDYDDIPCSSADVRTIDGLWKLLTSKLTDNGFNHIYQVTHHERNGIAVVKLAIPKMEHFEAKAKRIGPRLWSKIQSQVM